VSAISEIGVPWIKVPVSLEDVGAQPPRILVSLNSLSITQCSALDRGRRLCPEDKLVWIACPGARAWDVIMQDLTPVCLGYRSRPFPESLISMSSRG
jgi:hypothetical protein